MDTSHPAKKTVRYWPLWIPRAILLIAILGLFLYTVIDYTFIKELSPRYWDFGLNIYPMVSAAILLAIAWFTPVIGGILTLIASIVALILGFLVIVYNPMAGMVFSLFLMWGLLFAVPGALFLIFGLRRSKRKNE